MLKKKPAWVAWQAAPSDAKQAVLEKTQTLCADPGSSVAQALAAIAEDAVERSVLTSAVLNSYAFEGATEALFAVGGKAEHSCAPNAKFGVAAKGGEWRALRAIAAGEPVSVSYYVFSNSKLERIFLMSPSNLFLTFF